MRDTERIDRNRQALADAALDAFVCSLPMNVLLLTGYWPVIGTSIAIFTRSGETFLLAAEDEFELAQHGRADHVETFSTGSLSELKSYSECVKDPFRELIIKAGVKGQVGVDGGVVSEPASYAATTLTRLALSELLTEEAGLTVTDVADDLERLRSVLTPDEISRLKIAVAAAGAAFHHGCRRIEQSKTERQIAHEFRGPLSTAVDSDLRADGFTYCMSGENSYNAYAAFQRSTGRALKKGDAVLVHCNSYVEGYWTDITRTYSLGDVQEKRARIYECIFTATQAALDTIRPGARAADVDRVARNVLRNCGMEKEFRHGLGHGVGFHAIDHMAIPRLHPASSDVLEAGMVFNIEPAVYIEGYGGIRQCNMVAINENGAELLTPFHNSIHELLISG